MTTPQRKEGAGSYSYTLFYLIVSDTLLSRTSRVTCGGRFVLVVVNQKPFWVERRHEAIAGLFNACVDVSNLLGRQVVFPRAEILPVGEWDDSSGTRVFDSTI